MSPMKEQIPQKYCCLKEIRKILKECDCIKYAAYRTSSKLRIVQKTLFMDIIPLKVIASVFKRHQLQENENSMAINRNEIESILSDIYFVIQKGYNFEIRRTLFYQSVTELLLSIYDKEMRNTLPVLSFKIFLALLCKAQPQEKYHYFFQELADQNNLLTRKGLCILLKNLISVIEYIGEGCSFGNELIAGTVESCFQTNNGALGISEQDFICWLMQDPQLLVSLSTLHRIQISELVTHNVKCRICKVFPIIGLRYQCLRCFCYNICQKCFFSGKLNDKHKPKHPVQEYCYPVSLQQSTKAFLLTLRNILCKKNFKLQYLPVATVDINLSSSTKLPEEVESNSKNTIGDIELFGNRVPSRELQNIILCLESASKKLIPQIEAVCENLEKSSSHNNQLELKNCLIKHKFQIEDQICRLKLLKNYLIPSKQCLKNSLTASTPVVNQLELKFKGQIFDSISENLSPIKGICSPDSVNTSSTTTVKSQNQKPEKKLMWDNYDMVRNNAGPSWEEIDNGTDNSFDILQEAKSVTHTSENEYNKNDINAISDCSRLMPETLQDSPNYSRKGFTWIQEDSLERLSYEDNKKLNNKDSFNDLRTDLKDTLRKLNELSIGLPTEKGAREMNLSEEVDEEIKTVEKVDSLMFDLIKGIEKLIGKETKIN